MIGDCKHEKNLLVAGWVDWDLSFFLEGLCKCTKPRDMTIEPVPCFKFEPSTSQIYVGSVAASVKCRHLIKISV